MAREHDAHMTALYVAQCARNTVWTTDCAKTAAAVDIDQRTKADAASAPNPERVGGRPGTGIGPGDVRHNDSRAASPPITLPWPPSGNSAVRHAQGSHYLRPEILTYRAIVADLCARYAPILGRYRLHVHMSPPDARRRDADNALKSLLDALVKAGYLADDSLTYMRELLVTVDDDRLGHVRVDVRPA